MATLTNPIEEQNIVNRFADYVVATANAGISWGTNNKPFSEMPDSYFGGTTSGTSIAISGSNIYNDPINATSIYNAFVSETNRYTRIRNMQAKLNVTGDGGNLPLGPRTPETPGILIDTTAVAHMSGGYQQNIGSPSNGGVAAGNQISVSNIQQLFTNLRNSYNSARGTTQTITIDVCHANCHSNCHSSGRSRR